MKKLSYEELGRIIGDKASEYFERFYSDNLRDYMDDVRFNTIDDDDLEEYTLEVYEVGKQPLLITFYMKDDEYYI